jgi:tyrosine-protein phosphatase SIW14
MTHLIKAFFLLTLFIAHCALAETNAVIRNFSQVTDGVYRGGAPDNAGTAYLASLHIITDVDLESFRWPFIWSEKHKDKPFDIHFMAEPLFSWSSIFSYIQPPITDKRMDKILDLLADPAQQPVFVHCELGEDRTGLVIGLYRVTIQHWSPEDAWNEMLKFGYHPHFYALTHYFEKRTGWKPDTTEELPQPSDELN